MSAGWLEGLNRQQREAVVYGDGPLLVIAGAGTGKTRTLACRVAHLIGQGVPPERVLLLTFTRRAAAEMLTRADHMTGRKTSVRVWGGTFHAVANRLLHIYGRALGLAADFTVIDQGDAADMMNLIRTQLGLTKGKRRFPRKETLASIYSRTVNARDKLSDVLEKHFPWCRDNIDGIRRIFDLYTQRKRANNVLDYDDLLLFWKVLAEAPGVGESAAHRFEHVLVDEYQDTNAIQGEILIAMRKQNKNITVVGDDAQSIYSFRAATVRNILDFPKHFPGTRVVTLEQNYRSTQPILAASNAVMAPARERYTKELWSERAADQKPILFTCLDEAEQCDVVCDHVLRHLEMGIPLMRQAVLFRAGYHSDQLEVELARRNIPFHKYGGLKFIEAAHVKDLLAFLRVLENPHDEISWFRVLLLLEGIGAQWARRIMAASGVGRAPPPANDNDNAPVGELLLNRLITDPPAVPTAARKQFEQLRAVLAECAGLPTGAGESERAEQTRYGEPSVATQIERIRHFYEPIFQQRYDNAALRLRDLEQLEQIAARYRSRGRFITDLTLDPPSSTSDLAQPPFLEEDYLVLSTIHSAKGCEWDVVHIIHAADGMIPSDMAVSDEAGLEEERRLFYVAMTRTKEVLYIYFPLRYYHHRSRLSDAHNYAQLTRFLPKSIRHLFEQRAGKTYEDDKAWMRTSGIRELEERLRQLWRE